jgi:hypothetical protein
MTYKTFYNQTKIGDKIGRLICEQLEIKKYFMTYPSFPLALPIGQIRLQ